MTGDKYEAEKIVSDGVVESGVEVGQVCSRTSSSCASCSYLRSGNGVAAEQIDGAAFGGGGEPCRGILGDAGLRPLFECRQEGFLGEVFGEADVAGEAGKAGDDARGLDAPDGFNGAMQGRDVDR